jgi:hypothetical protein
MVGTRILTVGVGGYGEARVEEKSQQLLLDEGKIYHYEFTFGLI